MVLRILFRYLSSNEQLISKIAESYPIRRAAQMTVYVMNKAKETSQERMFQSGQVKDIKDAFTNSTKGVSSFSSRFGQELKNGLKDINEELKRRK